MGLLFHPRQRALSPRSPDVLNVEFALMLLHQPTENPALDRVCVNPPMHLVTDQQQIRPDVVPASRPACDVMHLQPVAVSVAAAYPPGKLAAGLVASVLFSQRFVNDGHSVIAFCKASILSASVCSRYVPNRSSVTRDSIPAAKATAPAALASSPHCRRCVSCDKASSTSLPPAPAVREDCLFRSINC